METLFQLFSCYLERSCFKTFFGYFETCFIYGFWTKLLWRCL